MKILLPFFDPFNRAIDSPIISAGIEKFCKHIYENFNDVIVHQIPFNADRKLENDKLLDSIYKHKPDLIVTNYEPAMFTNKKIVRCGYPIVHVAHMGSAMISYLLRLSFHQELNQTVLGVSAKQNNDFIRMSQRCKIDFKGFDGIITPSYVESYQTANIQPKFDTATIGRMGSQKNPFLLKELANPAGLSSQIFTSPINECNNNSAAFSNDKYIKRVEKYFDDSVFFGTEHSEIMDKLKESNVFFSTWKGESFGITVLEALSRGLPCIVNSSHAGHASECIPADSSHLICVFNKDPMEFKKAYDKLKHIDKQSIIDKTYEKHNKELWLKQITLVFEKAIDKFNKHRNTLC